MELGHIQRVKRLYKTILKLHKGLPPELQILGTNYTRDEFKRHKKCNIEETRIFLNEWSVNKFIFIDQNCLQFVFLELHNNVS